LIFELRLRGTVDGISRGRRKYEFTLDSLSISLKMIELPVQAGANKYSHGPVASPGDLLKKFTVCNS
jgi:hypothetical protein